MAKTEGPSARPPDRKVGRGAATGGTGSFAPTQTGGKSDGTSSARPPAVTGKEDATFESGSDQERRN